MLRLVRNGHLRPRLMGFQVTSAGTSPTAQEGKFDLGTITGITGNVTCPLARPFSRAPVVVATKMGDVGANGAAYVVSDPTLGSIVVGSHAGGSGVLDDGTVNCLALGWDSRDTDKYRKAGFNVRCAWDTPAIKGFKVNTTTPTINIGPGGATITKTGTGDVTITFKTAYGCQDVVAVATPILGTVAEIETTTVTSSVVRVKLTVAGTPTDGSFYLMVLGSNRQATTQTRLRDLENDQRNPRLIGFQISYTTGTPSITTGTGDVTIVDTGAGDLAVTFTDPFKREPIVIVSPGGVGISTVKAAATSSAVSLLGFDSGGTPADLADLYCLVLGWDDATIY